MLKLLIEKSSVFDSNPLFTGTYLGCACFASFSVRNLHAEAKQDPFRLLFTSFRKKKTNILQVFASNLFSFRIKRQLSKLFYANVDLVCIVDLTCMVDLAWCKVDLACIVDLAGMVDLPSIVSIACMIDIACVVDLACIINVSLDGLPSLHG
jgi:hypothetical protein